MALTTAYAGHADITDENAGAILNQFLPEDPPEGEGLGLVLIPERVTRVEKGLKATIAWLEKELGGADATIPVPDLIKAMLDRKEAEGDDLELYLLFDPENEADVALAAAADEAGIPVRNLAGAGDFIVFEEAAPEDETPPFDTDEPEAEVPARALAESVAESVALMDPGLGLDQSGVSITLTLSQQSVDALAAAIVRAMSNQAAQSVQEHGLAPVASVTPIRPDEAVADKPAEPTGRTEQVPGSAAFYYNAVKGTYRKARGIARDGESKVFLTEAEQEEARTAKLLA